MPSLHAIIACSLRSERIQTAKIKYVQNKTKYQKQKNNINKINKHKEAITHAKKQNKDQQQINKNRGHNCSSLLNPLLLLSGRQSFYYV
jgi:hypothetical protein